MQFWKSASRLQTRRFVQADRQKAEAKESQEHYDALVQGAEDEKKRIVAEAREEASAEYGRIVADAKDKADGIVEKAKADAENEKAAAMQQADAAVRDMVVTAAARMVARKDAKESDRAFTTSSLDEAENSLIQEVQKINMQNGRKPWYLRKRARTDAGDFRGSSGNYAGFSNPAK